MAGLRFLTAGESHGKALVAILEGLPAGVPIEAARIERELARRRVGHGRGFRMKIEPEKVEILSGVRHGQSLGSPIALRIENRDWENWRQSMAVEAPGGDPGDPDDPKAQGNEGDRNQAATTGSGSKGPGEAAWRSRPVTRPRPGHADLAGALKYGRRDIRDVLERASARETAARTAAGALCRAFLESLGVQLAGHVVAIGLVRARPWDPDRTPLDQLAAAAEASPVRCADPEASAAMVAAIDRAREQGDSLGGVFEVIAGGVPPGLGSYAQWDRRLDGRLSQALAAIPAIKGVEVGAGFAASALPGSEVHDAIFYGPIPAVPYGQFGAGTGRGFFRRTNRAGGLEGGVTNGQALVVRAAMKPIPTLTRPLPSADLLTGEPYAAAVERTDVCSVPAACVVGEAAVALVLASAWLEKFGGDSLEEVRRNVEGYVKTLDVPGQGAIR